MKSFSKETLNFFFRKFRNKKALSTGEPCTYEYVTLLQSFHRGTLRILWYIDRNFWPTFSLPSHLDALLRPTSLAAS